MTDSILGNAVISLGLGVEDFLSDDYGRSLSAIRNIYAGTLLLCKEVLGRNSPKNSDYALVKSKLVPAKDDKGHVIFIGKGRATVNRRQIQERFEGLGLALDWKRLQRVAEIRNDVEHYYTDHPEALIREALSDAFVLIHTLVVDLLNEMPIALLGKVTWATLLETNEVFENQRAACLKTFEKVQFTFDRVQKSLRHMSCPKCGSCLIEQGWPSNEDQAKIDTICSQCGATPDAGDILEEALTKEFRIDNYVAFKDAGKFVLETCPECDRNGYLIDENQCAFCGFTLDGIKCAICSAQLTPEDYAYGTGGLCSDHRHMMSNDN